MTRTELFRTAHKITRETRGDADYRATFGLVLRELLSGWRPVEEAAEDRAEAAFQAYAAKVRDAGYTFTDAQLRHTWRTSASAGQGHYRFSRYAHCER